MPFIEPVPLPQTPDPYPVTRNTIPLTGGIEYEYARRHGTSSDPQDILNLIVEKLYVTDFQIIGGGESGGNLREDLEVLNPILQVYGSVYTDGPVFIGGLFGWSNDPVCFVDSQDIQLYVNGDAAIGQKLSVGSDCCIEGYLTKRSGTFDITHPAEEEKRLRHSFIEGPRYDNIYRNKVRLENGKAFVNLDTDCVSPGGQTMTPGTWEKLNRNPDIFLQNLEGWSRLRGKIEGSILEIECEDGNCTDLISWMVVAERHDDHIMNSKMSDDEGRLILEY
jgi:hypothetical protein